jgi:UDP:flavonoid glycosyltransferase YjiC (YdhE family)
MDRMLLPPVNAMRRAEGLVPYGSATQDAFLSPRFNLVASSPSLFPRPADWADTVHLCGAFHLPVYDRPSQLPGPLERFLLNGPAPVFMTIGSMSVGDPSFGETVRLFREAARLAVCRAIIQAESAPIGPVDATVLYLQSIEHHLLFPRCAAVVHHGGAGTTHAASRAGVPSIVVEHATDQAFWGSVLHRAGISPPMLHRRTVTAAKLARAITAVLDSAAIREKARVIGACMRQENGVARAIELIEQQRWS